MPPLTPADSLTPMRRLLADESFSLHAGRIAEAHRQRLPDAMATVLALVQDLLAARVA
jgi:hypothetical protein